MSTGEVRRHGTSLSGCLCRWLLFHRLFPLLFRGSLTCLHLYVQKKKTCLHLAKNIPGRGNRLSACVGGEDCGTQASQGVLFRKGGFSFQVYGKLRGILLATHIFFEATRVGRSWSCMAVSISSSTAAKFVLLRIFLS